jgi:hypothetical protein
MKSTWAPALLVFCLLECVPAAVSGPAPEEAECRVRSGERISIRDGRLKDPTCIIEAGVTLSVLWDEFKTVPVKKVEMIVVPMCGREDEIVLLEQAAYEKLDTMQSMPIEVIRTSKPCERKPRVDVVILETGI